MTLRRRVVATDRRSEPRGAGRKLTGLGVEQPARLAKPGAGMKQTTQSVRRSPLIVGRHQLVTGHAPAGPWTEKRRLVMDHATLKAAPRSGWGTSDLHASRAAIHHGCPYGERAFDQSSTSHNAYYVK